MTNTEISQPTLPQDPIVARLLALSKWLVFFAAFIPALGSLGADFYWIDDRAMVLQNPLATAPFSLKIFIEPHFNHFSPLHELAVWLQWHLFGAQPLGYRLVSMLLHGGAALTCLAMLRNLTGRPLLALGATLIWAVHPIQPESVDWIAEQKTLLCGLFCFWSLAVYFDRNRKRTQRVAIAVLLMALGSLGKSHGLYVGPVILLYELCGLSGDRKRGLLNSIPFLILTVVVAKLALWANSYTESIANWTLRDMLLNLPGSLMIYLRTAFLPWTASFFQEMERVTEFATPPFWAALLGELWIFAAGCFLAPAGSRRLFVFLALAWGAALGPMLNVSQTTFPAYDRFQYVALPFLIAGAALMIEGLITMFAARPGTELTTVAAEPAPVHRAIPIVWTALLAIVAVLGLKRGFLFRDESNVMLDAVIKAPANACSHAQLANTLYPQWRNANEQWERTKNQEWFNARQHLAGTIAEAAKSAAACPNFADFYVTPALLLVTAGEVLEESGFIEEAIPFLELAKDEPRWERFKQARAAATVRLSGIAREQARRRILLADSPATSDDVAQELARMALQHVQHSRELIPRDKSPDDYYLGCWWEYRAHAVLARCFRKQKQDTQAEQELHAAESALLQIDAASQLYQEAQKALADIRLKMEQ